MPNSLSTISRMGKNKSQPEPTDEKSSGTVSVSGRVDKELALIAEEYVKSLRPPSSVSALIGMLLEEYLSSIGKWPPGEAKKET